MGNEELEPLGELWARAKGGDREAWNVLSVRYQRPNLLAAKGITRNLEDAEEVVQEAWLAAWERRASIEELGGFLRHTIRWLALNVVRNRKAKRIAFSLSDSGEDGEPIELAPSPHPPEEESVARKWIEAHPRFAERMNNWVKTRGVKVLPAEEREVAMGLWCTHPAPSRKELAARLGITVEAVNAAVRRICRKRDQEGERHADE